MATVDKFELRMNGSMKPIDRSDLTQRPRLFAFYRSVEETRLLLHAFRKLNVRKGGRCKYILAHLRARFRKSESESESECESKSESESESESESFERFRAKMEVPGSIYERRPRRGGGDAPPTFSLRTMYYREKWDNLTEEDWIKLNSPTFQEWVDKKDATAYVTPFQERVFKKHCNGL